jgi:thioredoxin-like negative regulator of GroEL
MKKKYIVDDGQGGFAMVVTSGFRPANAVAIASDEARDITEVTVLDVDDGFGGTRKEAQLDQAAKDANDAAAASALADAQAKIDAKEAKIANLKALNPNTDLNSIPQIRAALIEALEVLGLR